MSNPQEQREPDEMFDWLVDAAQESYAKEQAERQKQAERQR